MLRHRARRAASGVLDDLLAALEPPAPRDAISATAVPVSTGAMLALLPSVDDAARLAVDGGEPADQLHVTLMYLGKVADYPADARTSVVDAMRLVVANLDTLQVDGFALSVFNPGSSDQETAIVLGLSGPGLTKARGLTSDVARLVVAAPPEQHTPWVAHCTLAYTEDLSRIAEFVDRVGPVTLDRLRVGFGSEYTDLPLR